MNRREFYRRVGKLPPEDQTAINELIGILIERPELGEAVGTYLNRCDSIPRARDVLEYVKEAMHE